MKVTVDDLSDFADWLHNNWYEPIGTDMEWRLKVDDPEYTLPIPDINQFSSEELAAKYLAGEGEF